MRKDDDATSPWLESPAHMKFPLSPRVELEFFRQLWQKSGDPFWLCECAGEDFVLAEVNPAEAAIDARSSTIP